MSDINPFQYTLTGGSKAGAVVTWRYPDFPDLYCDGQVPDPLTGIVETLIARTLAQKNQTIMPNAASSVDDSQQILADGDQALEFLYWIVRISTDPIISNDIQEVKHLRSTGTAAFHTTQIGVTDLYALYYRALGVAALLAEQFHQAERADAPVESVSGSDHDGTKPGQTTKYPEEPAVVSVHGESSSGPVGEIR